MFFLLTDNLEHLFVFTVLICNIFFVFTGLACAMLLFLDLLRCPPSSSALITVHSHRKYLGGIKPGPSSQT